MYDNSVWSRVVSYIVERFDPKAAAKLPKESSPSLDVIKTDLLELSTSGQQELVIAVWKHYSFQYLLSITHKLWNSLNSEDYDLVQTIRKTLVDLQPLFDFARIIDDEFRLSYVIQNTIDEISPQELTVWLCFNLQDNGTGFTPYCTEHIVHQSSHSLHQTNVS